MTEAFIKSLLCAEPHAKCCTGSSYLIPAIILKGTVCCSLVTDGEQKLREFGSPMRACMVRVWSSQGLKPEGNVASFHLSSSSFQVCVTVNILSHMRSLFFFFPLKMFQTHSQLNSLKIEAGSLGSWHSPQGLPQAFCVVNNKSGGFIDRNMC